MSVKSRGSKASRKEGDLNVSLNVSPKSESSSQPPTVRKRGLSEKGLEYFFDVSKKNCETCYRKIDKFIKVIEELLRDEHLEEAGKKVETLVEVHKEFESLHIRYQELLHQQPNVPKEDDIISGEKVSQLVAQCINKFQSKVDNPDINITKNLLNLDLDNIADDRPKLSDMTPLEDENTKRLQTRQTLHDKIKAFIQAAETHIHNNELTLADDTLGEIENLFSEFMSYAPQCYLDHPTASDIDKEREFTDQVDNDVFAIRKKLSDAKATLEVHHPTRSSSTISSKHEELLSHLPSKHIPMKPPLPSKSGSRHSQKRSRDGGSQKTHSSRSKSRGRTRSPAKSHRSGRSGSSCSTHSSGNSSSAARDKALDEKARLAALKVESEYLKQSQKQELERRRLEMEADELRIEKEIAIVEARSKVYEEHLDSSSNYSDDRSSCCSKKSERGPRSKVRSEVTHKNDETDNVERKIPKRSSLKKDPSMTTEAKEPSGLNHLNDLCNLLKIQSAPDVDMDFFSGNPLEYQYFMSLFEELVERKIDDPLGKLARLIKYTRGEAKELIQHCFQMPQPDGFNTAKALLKKEYGDPHKVSAAYMTELRVWKTITAGNVREFKRFYRFLLKCNTNRKEDKYLTLLDNPDTLRNLQSKLPHKLQERWTRKAVQCRERNGTELVFSDFLEFVEMECKVLEDPVYSIHLDNTGRQDGNVKERRKTGDSEHRNESVNVAQIADHLHKDCLYCSEKHDIDACETFIKLPYKEKRAYLFNKKICFYCYNPFSAANHGYNKCTDQQRKCQTCGEQHPTALHRESKPNAEEVEEASRAIAAYSSDDMRQRVIGMPILPVRISHADVPGISLVVYALLDICSTGVFCLNETIEQLDVQSEEIVVNVRTINGWMKTHTTYVKGLQVESLDGGVTIPLPKAYVKDVLPVDHKEIISVETIEEFGYLRRVVDEIQHYPRLNEQDAIPIALVIGSNCPEAVAPIEGIPSQKPGPFAYRTQLGWCIGGPGSLKHDPDGLVCHRIQVEDVVTSTTATHEFVLKNQLNDVSIADKLKAMYLNDFNECESERRSLSVEDKKFVEIMEQEGRLVGNHHELPLPLRNPNPELPDNTDMVVKRLRSVEKRMLKDSKYNTDYIQFMSKMISCGYARKADPHQKVPEGMKWLVPHHGVYHPKTGKFRVVMDCSAKYQGRWLNAELLQGPDNTNLLVGVLLRFRQHEVAVMGDLEQMFYQIQVPEKHRSLLRFLWWPEGNTSLEPVEHEMCVHLFGAVSSPSVAGYALRKTALDGAKLYGDAAAEAVIRNFYVDDFCKSEKNTQLTVSLIRNVDSMCDSGGFNLTKLISNSREVLESIPVEKRAQALRMCNITDVTLPIERALGVLWNVENDALGFRIQFSSKPLSRKVILSDVTSIYDPDGRGSAFVLPGKKILQEITAEKEDWDAPLSEQHTKRWNVWKEDILALENVEVPRCYTPSNFGEPVSQSLHCFSDASSVGYGQVSYLRSVNAKGEVHVAQVMAKSRVAPLDSKTMPRLELTAGTVSVKVVTSLLEELGCPDLVVFYWTDSTIVLGYICNKTKRFRTYVANRVSLIHDYSSELQWRHVISEDNPADFTSRGLSPNSVEKVKMYFDGPTFLWEEEDKWPIRVTAAVEEDDAELKPEKLVVNKIVVSEEFDLLTRLETQFSSWYRLVRRMALVIKFVGAVKARVNKEHTRKSRRSRGGAHKAVKCVLSAGDISDAENLVIKLTQRKYMQKEFILLGKREPKASRDQEKESKKIHKRSSLSKLSQFLTAMA